jgi:hypothetical protein
MADRLVNLAKEGIFIAVTFHVPVVCADHLVEEERNLNWRENMGQFEIGEEELTRLGPVTTSVRYGHICRRVAELGLCGSVATRSRQKEKLTTAEAQRRTYVEVVVAEMNQGRSGSFGHGFSGPSRGVEQ